ncbi:MAG: c-type cytochrome [Pseudomonadales bacterium]|nr:c-type cytochrome [Pseudomonadales bacterium]
MRVREFVGLGLACVMAVSGAAVADTGEAAGARTVNDAVYTKSQARDGKRLFRDNCQMCHDRKYFGPVLRAWDGRTVGMLFQTMSSTMPMDNPGALMREDYVNILAYILDENGYPDGEAELDFRGGVLDGIVIAQP